jgi:aspartokinase-like uncharacterized kinase
MALVLVKVGGSLAMYPQSLRSLCSKLAILSKVLPILILPGGGEFADTVRTVDKRFSLTNVASHKMAILAMDQYGLLLTDLHKDFIWITELREVQNSFNSGKVPVILPSKLLFSCDPLENAWSVTSDSIALWIASQLHASKLLLVTDVDGVFSSDPHKNKEAKLLKQVTPAELQKLSQRTSVDTALPRLLPEFPIDCYVVNGLFPERIEAVLTEQETTCTHISDKPS